MAAISGLVAGAGGRGGRSVPAPAPARSRAHAPLEEESYLYPSLWTIHGGAGAGAGAVQELKFPRGEPLSPRTRVEDLFRGDISHIVQRPKKGSISSNIPAGPKLSGAEMKRRKELQESELQKIKYKSPLGSRIGTTLKYIKNYTEPLIEFDISSKHRYWQEEPSAQRQKRELGEYDPSIEGKLKKHEKVDPKKFSGPVISIKSQEPLQYPLFVKGTYHFPVLEYIVEGQYLIWGLEIIHNRYWIILSPGKKVIEELKNRIDQELKELERLANPKKGEIKDQKKLAENKQNFARAKAHFAAVDWSKIHLIKNDFPVFNEVANFHYISRTRDRNKDIVSDKKNTIPVDEVFIDSLVPNDLLWRYTNHKHESPPTNIWADFLQRMSEILQQQAQIGEIETEIKQGLEEKEREEKEEEIGVLESRILEIKNNPGPSKANFNRLFSVWKPYYLALSITDTAPFPLDPNIARFPE